MTLVKRFKKLYSGIIYDAMKYDLKYNENIVLNYIPLKEYNEPLVGYAFTCKGGMIKETMNDNIRIEMYESFYSDAVQIISSNGTKSIAYYGDISAHLTKKFGGVGCIIDGYTRDRSYINKLDNFQIYSKGLTIRSAYGVWEIKDYQCDISLEDEYGSVKISPRDLIFADNDGVIVIPNKLIETVLSLSEKRMDDENKVRNTLNDSSIDEIIKMKEEVVTW